MAKNKVVFKDKGLKAIEKAFKRAAKIKAKVGILDDPELALIGTVHEFGSPKNNIPSRSFMRSTVDRSKKELIKDISEGAKKLIKTKGKFGVSEILMDAGENLAKAITKTIASGKVPPPLKEETIKAKGSSKTLVDTGALSKSIKVKVG